MKRLLTGGGVLGSMLTYTTAAAVPRQLSLHVTYSTHPSHPNFASSTLSYYVMPPSLQSSPPPQRRPIYRHRQHKQHSTVSSKVSAPLSPWDIRAARCTRLRFWWVTSRPRSPSPTLQDPGPRKGALFKSPDCDYSSPDPLCHVWLSRRELVHGVKAALKSRGGRDLVCPSKPRRGSGFDHVFFFLASTASTTD